MVFNFSCDEGDVGFTTPPINRENGSVSAGQASYEQLDCALCHGEFGEGNPNRNGPSLDNVSDTTIYESLIINPPSEMEVYTTLTTNEVEDLAAYIGTFITSEAIRRRNLIQGN